MNGLPNILTIGGRLRYARKLHDPKRTQKAAADRIGVTPQAVSQWERGEGEPTRENLIAVAALYQVPYSWLGGEAYGQAISSVVREVPILAWVSAGKLMREDTSDDTLGSLIAGGLGDGDWIALRVTGDSMDRISPPESIIIINRKDTRLIANALYVIDDGEGNATYKRYRPGPPRRFEPVSTNKDLEPIFPDHDPTIIGRVRRTMLDM